MLIHSISGPRNISTALMYSFAQRKDTTVVDEPFYAHYLKHSGINHPGREETLNSMSSNEIEIFKDVIYKKYESPHVFFKNMAHHMALVDKTFLKDCTNLLLIRDPKLLIASFSKVIPNPTINDIGLKHEAELFRHIQESTGKEPIVIDSGELLKNPAEYMAKLCAAIGIPFDLDMLSWEAGARIEDGVWAKYWYHSVHKSKGFKKMHSEERQLPKGQEELYEEAIIHYNVLFEKAIKL